MAFPGNETLTVSGTSIAAMPQTLSWWADYAAVPNGRSMSATFDPVDQRLYVMLTWTDETPARTRMLVYQLAS